MKLNDGIININELSKYKHNAVLGYIYLAEYMLFKYHIDNGISEEDHNDYMNNIGIFITDTMSYYNRNKVRCIVYTDNHDSCRGFIAYRNDSKTKGIYIVSLYVDKEYRHNHIASKLLNAVIKETNKNTYMSLIADFNEASKHLFESFGFKYNNKSNINHMSEYKLEILKGE